MTTISTYRKQAKQLVRWHRERNASLPGRVRRLARFARLSDAAILDAPLPLALAQEIIAVEAGCADWAALKAAAAAEPAAAVNAGAAVLGVAPVLFVRDVAASAAFFAATLGFATDFLHGAPPFYGSVSRGGAQLHLRFVAAPNFAELATREPALIAALIEVADAKALFAEFSGRGAEFAQPLTRQAWGGLDFHVRDPDGNVIGFVEYRAAPG